MSFVEERQKMIEHEDLWGPFFRQVSRRGILTFGEQGIAVKDALSSSKLV